MLDENSGGKAVNGKRFQFTMKISIALCTYNGERYLREQLESIASQTRKPDEIIVCDDCSQDATVEIVRDFARNAAFAVRLYVNEENLRSTKNFERAISLCTGDVIFLSDQDDVWHESKLEKFAAEFEQDENVNLVFCDAELVDENLKPLGKTSWKALQFDAKQQTAVNEGRGAMILLNRNVVSGCMTAFRARYKNLILPIPDDLDYVIHDFWIVLLMLTVGETRLIAETLVKYRQHASQQIGLSADADE
ncbi:MAG: glycosyltransferase family 2 protein, partial [Pyrinomonadaceae bacterium]|nr:glycosyltransferase family 2 protein [Pyrinomonadaceae bacterium]